MSLDQPEPVVKYHSVTRDGFLGGRLQLSQPRHGFRAGLDSVLLGAAVRAGTGRLLELGAGVGTASLVALELGRAGSAMLAEREPLALELARNNVTDNGLSERAEVAAVDVEASAEVRRGAGLADNAFDAVIANPPFFALGTLAPDGGRAAARHMPADRLAQWARVAAAAARAGGEVNFIYPADRLGAVLAALEPRFGALAVLPLSPRPGEAASRVLVRGIKGSRAPLTLLASRPLHGDDGRAFAPEFDAIFRGNAALDW